MKYNLINQPKIKVFFWLMGVLVYYNAKMELNLTELCWTLQQVIQPLHLILSRNGNRALLSASAG